MSDVPSVEDKALLEALEHLESNLPLHELESSEEAEAVLEALATLPYELAPAAPPPEIRDRLLAAVKEAPPVSNLAPVRAFQPPAPGAPTRIPGWAQALAAGLVAAVVGLGISTVRLNESLARQQAEIASLTRAMMVGHLEAEAQPTSFLKLASDPRFAPIQTAGSKLFPITAVGSGPARGAVFVCSTHRRWYLRLSGLEPPAGDGSYRLWFVTEAGPVPVTALEVHKGKPLEVSADRMPPKTLGIFISMDSDMSSEEPPEPRHIVARGREAVEV